MNVFPRSPSEVTLLEDPDAKVIWRSGGIAAMAAAAASAGVAVDPCGTAEAGGAAESPLGLTGGTWAGPTGAGEAPGRSGPGARTIA
jgi:hypothetical protein